MFEYTLPNEKIARFPADPPDTCNLLIYYKDKNEIIDEKFYNLPKYVDNNFVFVFNTTKVQPVKILFKFENKKTSDTAVSPTDFIIYKILSDKEVYILTKKVKVPQDIYSLNDSRKLGTIVSKVDFGYKLILEENFHTLLERDGLMPIPPYLKREPSKDDSKWYQTIFAKEGFSIASPTASLHFTQKTIRDLKEKGVECIYLRLDVHFSTIFENERIPTTLSNEYYEIEKSEYEKLLQMKKNGKKIIAVGTTSCKTLETIANFKQLKGNSNLYITHPFEFKITDGLITNFHMSKSPTLSLTCAFLGKDKTKKLYEHALNNNYRFLSYGDAMFIIH